MKTIVILTPDSIRKPFGGLGVYLQETLKRFPNKEYRFLVIGVDTDKAHYGENYFYTPLKSVNEIKESAKMLKQAQLIHCMDANTFENGFRLKETFGLPLIAHVHLSEAELAKDLNVPYFPTHLARHEFNGLYKADLIVHVSNAYANRMPIPRQTVVIHNGINAADFKAKAISKVRLPGNNNAKKLLFIGRFAMQKGLQNLVRTQIPANVELFFVGGGNGSDPALIMEVLAFCANTSNAHYLGALWGDEKLSVIQQCDAMIVPSVHEPFGIVALEAIAAGKVLISSYADGMSDFLHPNNSIYCGKSPQTIQQALNAFSIASPITLHQLRANANSLLPQFTWEHTVAKLQHLYHKMIITKPLQHYAYI